MCTMQADVLVAMIRNVDLEDKEGYAGNYMTELQSDRCGIARCGQPGRHP